MLKEVDEQVRAAGKEAEALGTLDRGPLPPVSTMFEDVYKEMPWYLQRQRDELGL
jgi:2-oxoisovalerate dehydrogenase E1 component alpha subunit